MMQSLDKLFKGRHFERDIIVLCVRWYMRYKRSYRDLVEMIGAHVMVAPAIHPEDTPIAVLAPGLGKTRTGRLNRPHR